MNHKVSVHSLLEDVQSLWERGDREGALKRLRAAYQSMPADARLAFEYGHMLGELSSGASTEQKSLWRKESIEVLSKLLENRQHLSPEEQWKIQRHLYLYSGQHLQNRALGYKEIERGNPSGILSVGFGSLHHAVELAEAQQRTEAWRFAVEARDAFLKLREVDAPKPGRLLALALSQALLGCRQEALDTTSEATRLFSVAPEDLQNHRAELESLLRIRLQG